MANIKLTAPQLKALRYLAGGWNAVQRDGVCTINTDRFQSPTLNTLVKLKLAERFVLHPSKLTHYPTYAYRVTDTGREFITNLG